MQASAPFMLAWASRLPAGKSRPVLGLGMYMWCALWSVHVMGQFHTRNFSDQSAPAASFAG